MSIIKVTENYVSLQLDLGQLAEMIEDAQASLPNVTQVQVTFGLADMEKLTRL